MFKDFFVKKMLQVKGVSNEQAEMVIAFMNKNPDLFKQIAIEIETRVKNGENQEQAAMAVMLAHQAELQSLAK